MLESQLTTEERERQKAARRRFREIVKQRWEEEKLKTLSKKALQKISKKQSPNQLSGLSPFGEVCESRVSEGL